MPRVCVAAAGTVKKGYQSRSLTLMAKSKSQDNEVKCVTRRGRERAAYPSQTCLPLAWYSLADLVDALSDDLRGSLPAEVAQIFRSAPRAVLHQRLIIRLV